jgi:hypothetical protein
MVQVVIPGLSGGFGAEVGKSPAGREVMVSWISKEFPYPHKVILPSEYNIHPIAVSPQCAHYVSGFTIFQGAVRRAQASEEEEQGWKKS